MRELNVFFKDKEIVCHKLLEYGFTENGGKYIFDALIYDNQFRVIVEISSEEQTSRVIDEATGEEYALADVAGSVGDFIGKVKAEYENIINDIIAKCTVPDVFKSSYAKEIIKYVKDKYGDDLEYLWEKFPDNAVWRNKQNNKWFGALIVLAEQKLGLDSDKMVDIIDLRYQKEKISEIIDGEKVFAGYHMVIIWKSEF